MRGEADLHENLLLMKKQVFSYIFDISGPSRPQKWIWLEMLHRKMVWGRLET